VLAFFGFGTVATAPYEEKPGTGRLVTPKLPEGNHASETSSRRGASLTHGYAKKSSLKAPQQLVQNADHIRVLTLFF
jgi:hypothetical protein